ncbi:carbamoyltransferase N-terminal domain-containing protein [Nannocystis pusilla]|uniref:carbamoyltransferase N-terminal domain-containing protein n=1 Tax=Nannocystis pusilla TaxID=889268 RepID=UPI003B77AA05
MPRVLGISAHYHDAAAALVVDGEVVAAIQEERLSRIKNDPGLPLAAAFACLQHAGLQPGDLDAVAFYEEPFAKLERVLVHLLRHLPRTWRAFPRALAGQLGSKIWVLDHLSEGLGVARDRVVRFDHHRSHAASALLVSPYERAAVLVVDGVGEAHATTIWDGRGDDLRLLASVDFPHSLGLLYAGLTAFLGFAVNEGEYKVMGLAAWGQPRLREQFAEIVRLTGDGAYELDLACFAHMSDADLGFGPALERLLGPRRPPGRPWDFERAEDRHYADVAATLQAVLEDILLALARKARALTGADHLCLAGGVALNALANARLQAEAGFSRVFVQPAAGDAGGALGPPCWPRATAATLARAAAQRRPRPARRRRPGPRGRRRARPARPPRRRPGRPRRPPRRRRQDRRPRPRPLRVGPTRPRPALAARLPARPRHPRAHEPTDQGARAVPPVRPRGPVRTDR